MLCFKIKVNWLQVWRIIFGFSVLYFLLLVFMAFLNIKQVRAIMVWADPDIKDAKREVDLVEVSLNCLPANQLKCDR